MTIARYLNLNVSAPFRLAALKRNFDAFKAKHNNPNVKTWRDVRYSNFRTVDTGLNAGLNNKNPIWYCHGGEQFRNERDAHEVIRSNHTGWYTDVHQDGLAIGIIASLPHGRFIAGYRWTDNDERVYFPELFTDEDIAARMADEHACMFAESSMEGSEQYEAAQTLESKQNDELHRLKECIAMRHNKCFDYVRDEITELIESIKSIRRELSTTYKDYI